MNNVLLYIILVYILIVAVILISAARKSIRYKYRIKKVTVGTRSEYYIQKHFLFFWYTCQEDLQWPGDYEEVSFDTLEEAKKYIEKKRENR